MKVRAACKLVVVLTLVLGNRALADDGAWGSLTGRFVFDGPAPAPRGLDTKRTDVPKVRAEELIVDPDNRGVANVAVFLRRRAGVKVPVHPDYLLPKVFGATVNIRLQGFRFEPHVAVAQVGQIVVVENADPASHNPIFESLTGSNRTFQQHLTPKQTTEFKFKASDSAPISLRDNYFPWMQALVIVRDNPYVAVTDTSGKFKLKNLPVGERQFKICHDTGWVTKATLRGQPVEWEKGVATFEIKPGDNDLGDILVKLEPVADAETR